ncbi:MAG: hypothetical protein JWP38_3628 [Herbaspirillum sp.]|jgi:hypothetical protein|nr:hypothetical protein [Herbaspirillum sp.]
MKLFCSLTWTNHDFFFLIVIRRYLNGKSVFASLFEVDYSNEIACAVNLCRRHYFRREYEIVYIQEKHGNR